MHELDTSELKNRSTRTSHLEVFLGKGVLERCSKFIGGHPCRSVNSTKLQSNFTEIILRHGCSPVNLLHIFRTPFIKNISGWLLLNDEVTSCPPRKHIVLTPIIFWQNIDQITSWSKQIFSKERRQSNLNL